MLLFVEVHFFRSARYVAEQRRKEGESISVVTYDV